MTLNFLGKFKIAVVALISIFSTKYSYSQISTILPDSVLDNHKYDWEVIESEMNCYSAFTIQRIQQQYITNQNQMFLDVKIDTSYLVCKRLSDLKNDFKCQYFNDELGKEKLNNASAIENMVYNIRFNEAGKVDSLLNWTDFRDLFLNSFSTQARAGLIDGDYFKKKKEELNNEEMVRSLVLEDIQYVHSLYGDSLDLNIKYLRVKRMKSPFSEELIDILGSLEVERPAGALNSIKVFAQNKAGEDLKPYLLEECKYYLKEKNTGDTPLPEIQAVGLNSEQDFRYNKLRKHMIMVTLSDVVSINLQSRGNIRTFRMWEVAKFVDCK